MNVPRVPITSLSFSLSHKCGRLITFRWDTGRDSCYRQCVRLVAALSLHCSYF